MTPDPTSTEPGRAPTPPVRGGAANRRAAAGALPQRIAFVGFGLIGGSIAAALRATGAPIHMAAWTPAGRGPGEGRARGLVEVAATSLEEVLAGAGMVVLAGPPLAVIDALGDVAGARRRGVLAPDATITDVASTKARILARATELELPFVGGHPMAGLEVSGVAGADADLFVDRPWVVVPAPGAGNAEVVRATALAWATGARPVQLTAEAHDRAVAAISHLPLVVAAALVEAAAGGADWAIARDLAAGGWAGMTRLARGDAEMGAGILATNADEVLARLRDLHAALDRWIADLQGADADALRARLEAARTVLAADAGDAS